MELKFSTATFEMIQGLLYPLMKTLVGFDAQEWVGEKSELFVAVGEAFGDVGTLFMLAGTAIEDGLLTEEELEAIIAKAATLPEAIEQITGFFDDDPTGPTE